MMYQEQNKFTFRFIGVVVVSDKCIGLLVSVVAIGLNVIVVSLSLLDS